jgi:hypothetical protein
MSSAVLAVSCILHSLMKTRYEMDCHANDSGYHVLWEPGKMLQPEQQAALAEVKIDVRFRQLPPNCCAKESTQSNPVILTNRRSCC